MEDEWSPDDSDLKKEFEKSLIREGAGAKIQSQERQIQSELKTIRKILKVETIVTTKDGKTNRKNIVNYDLPFNLGRSKYTDIERNKHKKSLIKDIQSQTKGET